MIPFGEIVSSLGLGGSVAAAGTLIAVAWYLLRAKAVAGAAAGAASSATTVVIAVAAAFALALALGWVAPRTGMMLEHMEAAARAAVHRGSEPAGRFVRWLVDLITGGGA